MTNFRIIAMGAAAAIVFAGAAQAKDVEKTYDLDGFNRIQVSGVYQVDVTVGEDYAITLSGPEDEMNFADVSVDDGELELGTRKRERGEKRKNNREGVHAVISMPRLEGFNVSGVVEADIKGVDADAFDANLSGVGEVTLAGKCGELQARVSGVGELNAKALECRVVDVKVSGVGEANVYASEAVTAKVSGMGEINVDGSPKEVSKSGGMFSDITVR